MSALFAADPVDLVHKHVLVGHSKRVHIIRPGTVWTTRGWGSTYCGSYGRPGDGWMKITDAEATCKRCLSGAAAQV
jgi:hypothetical protein